MDSFEGLPWLNHNAWIASALIVVALTGAAVTMAWHIMETHSARYNYIAVLGLLLFAASFVLVGVSVGERPIVPTRTLIPVIRILWLAAALILNAFLGIYWSKRIHLRKSVCEAQAGQE